MEKINIIALQINNGGYYLSDKRTLEGSWNHNPLKTYLINNKKPEPTFEKEWVFTKTKPEKISKMVKQSNINYRYELQDKSFISKTIPEFIKREDVATYDSEEHTWRWKKEMQKYESLYKEIFDVQPDKEELLEFNFEIILCVDRIIPPSKMAYRVPSTQYSQDGYTEITEKNIIYQLADKIIIPNILLPQRPCKLTSLQTYKIVRQYVKDNIDPEVAKITSDYDFCFTVKKRIKLAEIKKYTVDVNNGIFQKRRRKPKYVNKQQGEREETCFEMTHSPKGYQGYTPIQGFQADTQKKLKEKIDVYCENLISFINTPLVECKHCKGDGFLSVKK